MSTPALAADILKMNFEFMKWTVGDFSDSDLMDRPVPNANSAMWQLGHLTASTAELATFFDANFKSPLSGDFAARFSKETARSNDPAKFPKKAEVIAAMDMVADATCAALRKCSEADMNKALPESFKQWAPTVGALAMNLIGHVGMHMGQIQVLRRKQGKPNLF